MSMLCLELWGTLEMDILIVTLSHQYRMMLANKMGIVSSRLGHGELCPAS